MRLNFIHIGKCGGATARNAIMKSDRLGAFSKVDEVHIKQPTYRETDSYLICIRNPIKRALSAFNWRYHLVVETEQQKSRFPGEYDVLQKYEKFDNLAFNLFNEEKLDPHVAFDFKKIHHLNEDIAFYLDPILPYIRNSQIFGVLVQEQLNDDINRILNVDDFTSSHVHSTKVIKDKLYIQEKSRTNLKNFLKRDYLSIMKLYTKNALSDNQCRLLI